MAYELSEYELNEPTPVILNRLKGSWGQRPACWVDPVWF